MNSRITGVLILALLVSAGATYLVYRAVASRTAQNPAQTMTQVVVAAQPLQIGAIIKDTDLKMGPWAGAVPAGMALKKEALIGRGVIAPIYAGEAIMESRLAAAGAGGGLAATIPPGMRAVAVRVNDVVGVAGFVVPGMRVDVLISGVPPGGSPGGPKVKTLLQNIQVLSAGQNIQKDAEGKPIPVPVVNLLVTPEQAEIMSLASNETRIQLVLRNPLDTQDVTTLPGMVLSTLYGGPEKAAPPASTAGPRARSTSAPKATPKPAPPPEKPALVPVLIEVYNGSQRSEAKFSRDAEAKQ